MSKQELHLWICDRCHQSFDREEQFRSRYSVSVRDDRASDRQGNLQDLWLCGSCYTHVEGVLKFGKVATNPPPTRHRTVRPARD